MTDTIAIGPQYYGFPGVGFGGYVSGRLAAFVGDSAQVTLRRPPPLEREMLVEAGADGRVMLMDGETLIAEAVAGPPDVAVPEAVGLEAAAEASQRFVGWRTHPFPMCFTCGIDRAADEGLRVFPGPLDDRRAAAATWVPDAAFADDNGRVRDEFVWAALDCPTYWGMFPGGLGPGNEGAPDGTLVLTTGRLHTAVVGSVAAGAPHVVMGWPVSTEGPKYLGGAAVFTADGELRAFSVGTWLPLPPGAGPPA
ncbi:MAG: hypothetical protein LC722_08535 [Actinobacteria bacterium]|nr:hypothetical protein [Actinomycetota bacterium]